MLGSYHRIQTRTEAQRWRSILPLRNESSYSGW
jgi:hypothetical protein